MALTGVIETVMGPASYHIITARTSLKFGGVKLILSSFYDEDRRGDKSLPPPSSPLHREEIVFSEFPDADVPDYAEAYTFINALSGYTHLESDEIEE